MVFSNIRNDLNRSDVELALFLVSGGSTEERMAAEALMHESGLDALLDDERLCSALLISPEGRRASLELFTYVIIRHALLRVNMRERIVAEYLASIFLHFSSAGRANKIGDTDDAFYDDLSSIAAELDTVDPTRSFLVRAHLGNFALWQGGLFPDRIAYRREIRGGPDLDYYDFMGQKGYLLAAQHRLASQYGLVDLYGTAAENFAVLRIALNNVSDELLFPTRYSDEKVLRQVSNNFRLANL